MDIEFLKETLKKGTIFKRNSFKYEVEDFFKYGIICSYYKNDFRLEYTWHNILNDYLNGSFECAELTAKYREEKISKLL